MSVFGLAATLLMTAVIFGGGGSTSPIPELIVQSGALACAALYAILPAGRRGSSAPDHWFFAATIAVILIPIVQLIPLPAAVWHSLPGREPTVRALTLIQANGGWRPLSLAPYATLASALSLIPPVVMIFLVRRLPLAQRATLLAWMAGLAAVAAVVGAVQLAGGDAAWLHFYPQQPTRFASGFQGNRNSSADILLIGLLSLAGFLASRPGVVGTTVGRLVLIAVAGFLVLSIVLTGSRAGMSLLSVCAIFALALFAERVRASRTLLLGVLLSILVIGTLGLTLKNNAAINRTLDRFETTEDQRPDLWIDTRKAINQYWPVGSGVGTFATVFPAAERLEVVDNTRPVRAHQDYLEFALEAGIAGLLLLVALVLAIGIRVVTVYRTAGSPAWFSQAIYASGVTAIVALHSLVDYPLRSMAPATVFAMAVAMLARAPAGGDERRGQPRMSRDQVRRPMAR